MLITTVTISPSFGAVRAGFPAAQARRPIITEVHAVCVRPVMADDVRLTIMANVSLYRSCQIIW
jgi:hypothetical protein